MIEFNYTIILAITIIILNFILLLYLFFFAEISKDTSKK